MSASPAVVVREIARETNVLRALSSSKDWSAAALLHQCFGGPSMTYFATLRNPELNSNVFFRPLAPAVVCAVSADDVELPPSSPTLRQDLAGVAQLLRVRLREAAGEGAEGSTAPVAYIQSVAVDEALRRRGIARELVKWCESRALEEWRGNEAVEEVWLAVAEMNAAALALYTSMGYERQRVAMGNVLMRKRLLAPKPTSPPASPPPPPSPRRPLLKMMSIGGEGTGSDGIGGGGIGWKPLVANVGVQALYAGVAALGVSLLLAPFDGPNVPSLLGAVRPWVLPGSGVAESGAGAGGGGNGALLALRGVAECALGAGVATAELARQGVLRELTSGGDGAADANAAAATAGRGPQLEYTRAQAEQMRPLYEIAGRELSLLPLALPAIMAWQLLIGVAEELYYRGFVESAGVRVLAPLSDALLGGSLAGIALRELPPLAVSAALFGLVHAEFVEGAAATSANAEDPDGAAAVEAVEEGSWQGGGVEDTKAFWFRVTALYGALYSALYVVSGHRLLAPVCTHAGINLGLCVRDWQRMRRTPDDVLARVFAVEPEA